MAIRTGSGSEMEVGPAQGRTFVRRSSGLVRDVSPANALFFSVAASLGGGMAFTFQNMTATGQPIWQFGLTAYAWATLALAGAAALLGIVYANLASAMPRAGANYIFTSRIFGPLPAWLESWTLVIAMIVAQAFLIPAMLLMLNVTGGVMAIAFPGSSLWDGAAGWFGTGDSRFLAGTILIVLACAFAILPNRFFHRALTFFGVIAVVVLALMVIVVPFLSHDTFIANATQLTGQTPQAIINAAAYPDGGFTFLGFMALCSFALFALIGFQNAAYISGEMAGNVKRSTLLAVLVSLAIAAFVSSFYNDLMAGKFGLELTKAWGFSFWTGAESPGGVVASPPTFGAIASPDLWPLWALCGLVAFLFTFLLMPVWFTTVARVMFAWTMDRQAPEWIGAVNRRTNAPLNAIIVCGVGSEIVLYLNSYQGFDVGSTLWFSILLFALAWIMPGVNAIFARRRRPELFADVSPRLPWIGAAWVVAVLLIYVTSVIKPIWEGLTGGEESATSYLSSSGVLGAVIVLVVGLIAYYVNVAANRARNVERTKVFAAIPPD